jgi:arginine-tRNA-protein transferase
LTGNKPQGLVDHLLRNGFRRSQSIAYTPHCEACNACVSVRVLVDQFRPGRSMRRTIERNCDLVARRMTCVPTGEQYRLFRRYIDARHPEGGMADMSAGEYAAMVADAPVDSSITEYRLRPDGAAAADYLSWPLKAVALCDRLSDGISLVYSFFEPTVTGHSLGTFMILDQIAEARRQGLPYAYLGYWIRGSQKMSYKSRFRPQEQLTRAGWVRA